MFEGFFMKLFTRYINQADNKVDDLKRAELLGFGGREVKIAPGAIVRVPQQNNIGSNIFIGLYTYVNGDVIIEDNVLIGPHCSLTAGHHKFDPKTGWFSGRTNLERDDQVRIGTGSWLASGVTVAAGVTVGKANLICANAVVTKDTPDYAIIGGIPGRVLGTIDPETGEHVWRKKDENN